MHWRFVVPQKLSLIFGAGQGSIDQESRTRAAGPRQVSHSGLTYWPLAYLEPTSPLLVVETLRERSRSGPGLCTKGNRGQLPRLC